MESSGYIGSKVVGIGRAYKRLKCQPNRMIHKRVIKDQLFEYFANFGLLIYPTFTDRDILVADEKPGAMSHWSQVLAKSQGLGIEFWHVKVDIY